MKEEKYVVYFFPLEQIPKRKIIHIVASEHPEVIEGRHRLIATHSLDHGDEAEDCVIDNYGSESD